MLDNGKERNGGTGSVFHLLKVDGSQRHMETLLHNYVRLPLPLT